MNEYPGPLFSEQLHFKGKARGWAGEGSSFTTNITLGDEMEYADNLIAFNSSTKGKPFVWFDRNGSDNIVLRNVGYNATAFVFNESRCERNLIQENLCYNIDGPGYETARYETGYSADVRWVNNVAYKCKNGFYVSKAWRNDFRNNITYLCKSYSIEFTTIAQECGPHNAQYNLWGLTTDNGSNCVKLGNNKTTASVFNKKLGGIDGPDGDPMFNDPDNGDFTLAAGSPAIGAGTLGCDLGAFAVYPPTEVGRDEHRIISDDVNVSFSTPVSKMVNGGTDYIALQLSYTVTHPVSVTIKAVAGDAREGKDFVYEKQVTFKAGEAKQIIAVESMHSDAQDDQLVAFRIVDVAGGKVGARNVHAVRVER